MSIAASINQAFAEYLKQNNSKPDTIYLTESAFLNLVIEMAESNPVAFKQMFRVIKAKGAVKASKTMRYRDMYLVVQEQSKAKLQVRNNKNKRDQDGENIELTEEPKVETEKKPETTSAPVEKPTGFWAWLFKRKAK
jgi:hypothetical protein